MILILYKQNKFIVSTECCKLWLFDINTRKAEPLTNNLPSGAYYETEYLKGNFYTYEANNQQLYVFNEKTKIVNTLSKNKKIYHLISSNNYVIFYN